MPEETNEALRALSWKGNVRELANAVERAVILCRTGRLTPDLFPETTAAAAEGFDLKELGRTAIRRALVATNGNRTRAARLLGISERTLRNKLNGPGDAAA